MLEDFLTLCFELKQSTKRKILLAVDTVLLLASFMLSMALRLDGFAFAADAANWSAIAVALGPSILGFIVIGQYDPMVRFISDRALRVILLGCIVSAALLQAIALAFGFFLPRSVPLIYALVSFLALGGIRFMVRALHRRRQMPQRTKVLIYGAGESGRQLLASLKMGFEYEPIAFVDDSPELWRRDIGGHKVSPPSDLSWLLTESGVEAVLLAIPSATRAQRKVILDRLEPYSVRVQTIPGMADILSGRATLGQLTQVSVEDLLGRDPVPPREDLMDADICDKVVLVTGAGGSIGSELCRQIVRQRPECLVLVDSSEFALYRIDQQLQSLCREEKLNVEVVPLLGSVQDRDRMMQILESWRVDTIYHAAAYKHVPLVEQNVVEGVRNNVFGTLTIAEAAEAAGVGAFVLISSDKAVRPTNVMGATKRMAELVCQALAGRGSATKYSMVRFGNVLGSSGSVIPLFKSQIEAGGPITVTHPEITRYFMTIPEAAQLVIQAGAMAKGGDVFVLDMGEPVRIIDLAKRMAGLYGLKSLVVTDTTVSRDEEGDIEITFSSLRPGEKLYEELLIGADSVPSDHPRILTANETFLPWERLRSVLDELAAACDRRAIDEIYDLLVRMPTGYVRADRIVDFAWRAGRPTRPRMKTHP